MDNLLAFCVVYFITINVSVLQKLDNNHNQQIDSHKANLKSASYKYLDAYTLPEGLVNKKRVKRSNDRDLNRMRYPDEVFPSRNCTFGFCEEVENYPTNKIERIISQSIDFQKYFSNQPPVIDIFTRFGDDGENLCPTRSHTVFPKIAKNTHGVEQLLVNVGEFKQGVNFESCLNAGNPCKFSEVFPNGYTTICQQKYTVRRLMAIGQKSDKPIFDNFEMPSCCICTIKKD